MAESIISEGKTTNEAIENGLKELGVTKNMVNIEIIEEKEKRSFFSILAPRVVKVKLTKKEKIEDNHKKVEEPHKEIVNEIEPRELEKAKNNINKFISEFLYRINKENVETKIYEEDGRINISLNGDKTGILIGYRGETINALQTLMSNIANKNTSQRIRVSLDIEGYREKRKNTLEALAVKLSKTVLKTGKSITLEPMPAYERKIIHSKLQQDSRIRTYSIGEEPYRKIVIEKI